jgi:peroxiredoxin
LPEVGNWQREYAGKLSLALISRGGVEANRTKASEHGVTQVLLQQDREVATSYQAYGTPSAVLIRPDGSIGSPLAQGAKAIRALVAQAIGLPDLAGQTVNLVDFRGHQTLLLFWNPGCGFCQRMLDDLRAWEAKPPKGAPKLLVISTGTMEANTQMGLHSPILLDQGGMSVGSTFGANGTPMAVLLDTEGKIASEVAAGAPAVLALAGVGQDTVAPPS